MDNLTAGNPRAHAVRVYYNDTDTIYEGMPVCYNYDTDTNWFGGSVSDAGVVSATTTTADGSQNERRYIEVESPTDNNLNSFAGVVKKGGWCGKSSARVLDIYVPNGAIVPVRCDVDTTKGVTVLAITVDSQEFGQPVEGTSRVVAIAAEDETGLDGGTPDITLATLDPNRFLYQDLDGTALSTGAGVGDYIANSINVTSAQTAGRLCALHIKSTLSSTGGSDHYGLAFHAEGILTGSTVVAVNAASARLTVTSGTPTEGLHAFKAYFKETGATMDSLNGRVSVLSLGIQVTHTITATHGFGWIYLEDNSTYKAEQFILSGVLASLPAVAMTTADHDLGTNNGDYAIKVLCSTQPGTQQWYIPLIKDL